MQQNAAKFCSEGIFFTRQNMGQIFFFNLELAKFCSVKIKARNFVPNLPPKNELVSVLGDVVTGMIVKI